MRPDGQWGGTLRALHRFGVTRSTSSVLTRPLRWASWGAWLSLLTCRGLPPDASKLRSLGRLWGWQIWRRTVRRPVEVVLPAGRLAFPPWSTLAGITAATGMHEPAEQTFVLRYLRPDDGVIDVGANLGIYAVMCGGLGARVWAFEPSTLARGALEHNVRINHLDHLVTIYPVALGDANGRADLTTGLDGANHFVSSTHGGPAAPYEVVEVRTLDSLLAEAHDRFGGSRVTLLKVDVEGHDDEVLKGASDLLLSDRPVVIVESWAGGAVLRRLLADAGYRVYWFDRSTVSLVEYPESWAGQANFIAVADERIESVRDRIREGGGLVPHPPVVRWWPVTSAG